MNFTQHLHYFLLLSVRKVIFHFLLIPESLIQFKTKHAPPFLSKIQCKKILLFFLRIRIPCYCLKKRIPPFLFSFHENELSSFNHLLTINEPLFCISYLHYLLTKTMHRLDKTKNGIFI